MIELWQADVNGSYIVHCPYKKNDGFNGFGRLGTAQMINTTSFLKL
jgi:protocatechuate 3,4-dioxygenase beta subunit